VSANPKQRNVDPVITFPSQGRIEVNVWNLLQDVDQDGDGVRGMFVRKVDGKFCEPDVALCRSGGLLLRSVSSRQCPGEGGPRDGSVP